MPVSSQPIFTIRQRIVKGKDVLNFYLAFEKNEHDNSYSFTYYDAILRKEIEIHNVTINQIVAKELDKRMEEINWTSAFSFQEKKAWRVEDKTSWLEEEKVENVVTDLQRLESMEEGKEIADRLKMKHWCDEPVEKMIGNLGSLRGKFEINQRFYFFDGQSGISVEEAYRFLHNDWMEKQLLAKKKQVDILKVNESDDNGKTGSDKGLLYKKRKNKRKKVKI